MLKYLKKVCSKYWRPTLPPFKPIHNKYIAIESESAISFWGKSRKKGSTERGREREARSLLVHYTKHYSCQNTNIDTLNLASIILDLATMQDRYFYKV